MDRRRSRMQTDDRIGRRRLAVGTELATCLVTGVGVEPRRVPFNGLEVRSPAGQELPNADGYAQPSDGSRVYSHD